MSLHFYTATALASVVVVVVIETAWLRTGLFATARYWISLAIVAGFQVLVDGWLTKLSDPIVRYSPAQFSGVRFPWDIPVEDFAFGFSMVTLTLLLWCRLTAAPDTARPSRQTRPSRPTRPDQRSRP